ncbi:MAG: hypothetical protein IPJ01_12020 [Micavibrio sp.]|nr:hypothetical protein [Micavibrio sp.]
MRRAKNFLVKCVAYLIAGVLFPFIVLRELRNLAAFFIFALWRAHRANQILHAHGWPARQYFLQSQPLDYAAFVKGGERG